MNELLQLILTRIEKHKLWDLEDLRPAILEEFAKMGGIKRMLESSLLPAITDEGRQLIIREAIKEIDREG